MPIYICWQRTFRPCCNCETNTTALDAICDGRMGATKSVYCMSCETICYCCCCCLSFFFDAHSFCIRLCWFCYCLNFCEILILLTTKYSLMMSKRVARANNWQMTNIRRDPYEKIEKNFGVSVTLQFILRFNGPKNLYSASSSFLFTFFCCAHPVLVLCSTRAPFVLANRSCTFQMRLHPLYRSKSYPSFDSLSLSLTVRGQYVFIHFIIVMKWRWSMNLKLMFTRYWIVIFLGSLFYVLLWWWLSDYQWR